MRFQPFSRVYVWVASRSLQESTWAFLARSPKEARIVKSFPSERRKNIPRMKFYFLRSLKVKKENCLPASKLCMFNYIVKLVQHYTLQGEDEWAQSAQEKKYKKGFMSQAWCDGNQHLFLRHKHETLHSKFCGKHYKISRPLKMSSNYWICIFKFSNLNTCQPCEATPQHYSAILHCSGFHWENVSLC